MCVKSDTEFLSVVKIKAVVIFSQHKRSESDLSWLVCVFMAAYRTSTSNEEFILWQVSKFCSNILPFGKYVLRDLCPNFILKSPPLPRGFANRDFLTPTQIFVISCISLSYATSLFPPVTPVTTFLVTYSLLYTAGLGALFMSFVYIMMDYAYWSWCPCIQHSG